MTHKPNLIHSRHNQGKKGQIIVGGLILVAILIVGAIFIIPLVKSSPATMEEMSELNDNQNHVVVAPPKAPAGCPEGQGLDSNGNCQILQCPSGQVRNTAGKCQLIEFAQPELTKPCVASGYIKTAYVRTKGNVGELTKNDLGSYPAVVSYQFQVTSDCDATYYFETGLKQGTSLTILNPAGSKCDGNNHYSGRFITMNKNTIVNQGGKVGVVDIAFFPLDYGKAEKLTVVGGVYTGCFKDGGSVIDEIVPTKIDYKGASFAPYSSSDVTLSWVKQ